MSSLDELTALVADHERRSPRRSPTPTPCRPRRAAAAIEALNVGWTGRKSRPHRRPDGRICRRCRPPTARRSASWSTRSRPTSKRRSPNASAALAATRRPAGAVDVTLPGRAPALGHRHPLSLVREQVQAIFTRLGYQVLEGPEIEDDCHNFEALNMPEEHPARDMQDTLYLERAVSPARRRCRGARGAARAPRARGPQPLTLLRTHTSAMQIRYMEQHDPPVRLVAHRPGLPPRQPRPHAHADVPAVRRAWSSARASRSRDLKGTLLAMAEALFGAGTAGALPPELLPVHRAERRSGRRLHPLRRRRLPGVQAHRLARDPRQRHGAPGGLRGRRLRPGDGHRASPSAWASSASRC